MYSNVSLIYAYRKDVDDRESNLYLSTKFFKAHCPNIEIIVVENDIKQQLTNPEVLKNIDRYEFIEDKTITNFTYCKSKSLNRAVHLSNRQYIIQCDVDCVINPIFLKKAIEKCNNNTMVIPYTGTVILTTDKTKELFEKQLKYTTLWKLVKDNYKMSYKSDYVSIAHSSSVGGIGVYSRILYLLAGGFNTNFKGWGYEDVEIIDRLKILGYNVERITDKNACLWHLKHKVIAKERQPNYRDNKVLYERISSKSKTQMLDYINNRM